MKESVSPEKPAMAEATKTLRSDASSSPTANSNDSSNIGGLLIPRKFSRLGVEKNLTRCVRRKLHYVQTTVKCQRQSPYRARPLPRSPFKLPGLSMQGSRLASGSSTVRSCPDSTSCTPNYHSIGAFSFRRSVSMVDLSPIGADSDSGDVRSDSSSTLGRQDDVGDRCSKEIAGNGGIRTLMWVDGVTSSQYEEGGELQNSGKAANLVCHALVLNAWRRRRDEISHLRETIDRLAQEIEHLHLQIVVLRRLLDTENGRVGKLATELNRAKMQVEEISQERDALRTEKEKLEEKFRKAEDLSDERSVTIENLRNELNTANNQLQALDAQMSRDRDKLLKLREDKRILLDKVSASEALAAERGGRADKAESAIKELQMKLAAQAALTESVQDQAHKYFKELKANEEERMKLEKRLHCSKETGRALSLRAVSLESQLKEREATLQRVEAAYNEQLTELNELRERLLRQSQEVGWSGRMLQIAGSVVRAPRTIFRTLSFLSSVSLQLPLS